MKILNTIKAIVLVLSLMLLSCEDYLEVEAPDHKIVSENVFENDQTARSAMSGIYNQLATLFFSDGGSASVTVLAGLSGDVLMPTYSTNLPYQQFEQHELLPDNFRNFNLWSSAYNLIYMTNALLEGVANSSSLSEPVKTALEGEAKFIRAFSYFYLVNLYGDVPLILTTDYRQNALAERNTEDKIYTQIISDLEMAIGLLEDGFQLGDRTKVNRQTALALLARVQLYLENWQEAEDLSTQVINQNTMYSILEDPNMVFLTNSMEAIWQISPGGRGTSLTHTNEGASFIIHPIFSFFAQFKLAPSFVESFETEDERLQKWIGLHPGTGYYYPYKYKVRYSTEEITEYSMVIRLAELYLIRAEARAMQENYPGAVEDLDVIRERAGLSLVAETTPGIEKTALLDLIFEERKKELFTEWGHRWLDLKRTARAGEVLSPESPLWDGTDQLYPIPEEERIKNPNLTQNEGY